MQGSLFHASLVARTVKNQPAMRETQVQSLGWEDPLARASAFGNRLNMKEELRKPGEGRLCHFEALEGRAASEAQDSFCSAECAPV